MQIPEEQAKPRGYMAELDQWTQEAVIAPLYDAWTEVEHAPDGTYIEDAQDNLLKVVGDVKRAIREKALESYRNGQAAGPREPQSFRRPRLSQPRQAFSGA